ncbi:MAG: adenylate/guanylate cyclase domain-containing protein, partial [Caldimonas sp.]
ARLAPDLASGAPAAGAVPGGRRGEATLVVARLCGVDALASQQPAQETLELLGSWTTLMLDAVEGQGGLVMSMTGDGLTAVFGAAEPIPGTGGAPWAAVQAALEMRELAAQFNAERSALGKAPVALAIGIASGEVVAGHAGTPRRAAYVCVGAAVQRALRLEALAAERGAGALLVDAATQAALAGRVATDASKPVVLPGSPAAMPVHALRTA